MSLHFGCVDNHADGLQVAGVWVLIVAELCTHRLVELGELGVVATEPSPLRGCQGSDPFASEAAVQSPLRVGA